MHPNSTIDILMKKQMRMMETAELRFLRAVAGNRMADHKINEVVSDMELTDTKQ
jgi:hypothetical protein